MNVELGSGLEKRRLPRAAAGRFEGVEEGTLSVIFDYVFDYKMNPTKARVHVGNALNGDSLWVLVKRI